MTKEEAHLAARVWAANVRNPVDRDTQIFLMTTAAQRHKDKINRITKQLETEREKDNDFLD